MLLVPSEKVFTGRLIEEMKKLMIPIVAAII
jgi:hypothetical protein